jgi:hypothetical protein
MMEGLEEEVVPLCAPHNFGEVVTFLAMSLIEGLCDMKVSPTY